MFYFVFYKRRKKHDNASARISLESREHEKDENDKHVVRCDWNDRRFDRDRYEQISMSNVPLHR